MATVGVDFFRVDRSGSVRRVLVLAGFLVAVGAFLIGGHLVRRLGTETGHAISLAGGLMVAAGLVIGFGAMAMLLFENVYLLIGEEGVLCHENGKETKIAWGDFDRVTLDPKVAGFLVFERQEGGGEAVRWFAGQNAKDVRARVEEARRKALHGLFRATTKLER